MYNQIEDILLNISIVIANCMDCKKILGKLLKKSRIVYFLFLCGLFIAYSNFSLVIIMGACKFLQPF